MKSIEIHIGLFLLPLCMLLKINFVGEVYLAEVVLSLIFIFNARLLLDLFAIQRVRIFLFLLLSWLLSQVMSDVINASSLDDSLRGWAKIVLFGINVTALMMLIDDEKKLLSLFLGFSLYLILFSYFGIADTVQNESLAVKWKYGIGTGLLYMAVASILVFANKFHLDRKEATNALVLLLFIVALIGLAFNARSAAAFSIAALLVYLITKSERSSTLMYKLVGEKFPFLIVVSLFGVYCAGWGLHYVTAAGYLGDMALQKQQSQLADIGDPVLGLIVGGRPEIFSSVSAISDAPFFGHGSWAKNYYYVDIYIEALKIYSSFDQLVNLNSMEVRNFGLIPTHSHIFGAWVEAGIIGALFWLYVGRLLLLSLFEALNRKCISHYLAIAMFFPSIWDIFFSPFGSSVRFNWAVLLVVAFASMEKKGAKL